MASAMRCVLAIFTFTFSCFALGQEPTLSEGLRAYYKQNDAKPDEIVYKMLVETIVSDTFSDDERIAWIRQNTGLSQEGAAGLYGYVNEVHQEVTQDYDGFVSSSLCPPEGYVPLEKAQLYDTLNSLEDVQESIYGQHLAVMPIEADDNTRQGLEKWMTTFSREFSYMKTENHTIWDSVGKDADVETQKYCADFARANSAP